MRRLLTPASATAFLVLSSEVLSAQHDMSRWEDLFSQQPSEFRARYTVTPYFEEPVKGQDTEFSVLRQDFWAVGRIWGDGQNDIFLQGGVRHEEFQTGAILPDTGQPFPEELWDVHGGVSYRHRFDAGSVLGGSVSVGSASDQPFHSSREIVESVMAFFRLPFGDRDAWLFFLAYSNNRDYANSIPIPGVEYFYNPSPEFHAMVGFPLELVEWRPTPDLMFRCSYSLLHNVHALLSYRLADPLRAYVGFDWNDEGYLLVDRPDPKDRFFYDEKRAKVGVKLTLAKGLVLDLSGGYAFDRSYRESQHRLSNWFDRVDVRNGFFALASLEFALGRGVDRDRPDQQEKSEQD
jgi:hypothetical protein